MKATTSTSTLRRNGFQVSAVLGGAVEIRHEARDFVVGGKPCRTVETNGHRVFKVRCMPTSTGGVPKDLPFPVEFA